MTSAVLNWLQQNAPHNRFAADVNNYYAQKGYLAPGHVRAIEKILNTVTVNVAGEGFNMLQHAFQHARQSGLKKPKVHIGAFRFWPATDDSANPGYLYVKMNGVYGGKFSPNGAFSPQNLSAEDVAKLTDIARDPFTHAMNHGHMTGNCAICAKRLSDPESVTRGIGPICAKRFGWL